MRGSRLTQRVCARYGLDAFSVPFGDYDDPGYQQLEAKLWTFWNPQAPGRVVSRRERLPNINLDICASLRLATGLGPTPGYNPFPWKIVSSPDYRDGPRYDTAAVATRDAVGTITIEYAKLLMFFRCKDMTGNVLELAFLQWYNTRARCDPLFGPEYAYLELVEQYDVVPVDAILWHPAIARDTRFPGRRFYVNALVRQHYEANDETMDSDDELDANALRGSVSEDDVDAEDIDDHEDDITGMV